MFQVLKTGVAAAVQNAGTGADNQRKTAMEADTISKHGRSSKSQTSRGNILRRVCFGLVFCGLFFTGCSSNSPSDVVKKAFNAVKQKDVDTFLKYTFGISDSLEERLRNEDGIDRMSDFVKFEIQDERIFDNGEKAEVVIKFFRENGNNKTENMPLVKTKSGWKIDFSGIR